MRPNSKQSDSKNTQFTETCSGLKSWIRLKTSRSMSMSSHKKSETSMVPKWTARSLKNGRDINFQQGHLLKSYFMCYYVLWFLGVYGGVEKKNTWGIWGVNHLIPTHMINSYQLKLEVFHLQTHVSSFFDRSLTVTLQVSTKTHIPVNTHPEKKTTDCRDFALDILFFFENQTNCECYFLCTSAVFLMEFWNHSSPMLENGTAERRFQI